MKTKSKIIAVTTLCLCSLVLASKQGNGMINENEYSQNCIVKTDTIPVTLLPPASQQTKKVKKDSMKTVTLLPPAKTKKTRKESIESITLLPPAKTKKSKKDSIIQVTLLPPAKQK